jgi:anti-sigma B factor antagonist
MARPGVRRPRAGGRGSAQVAPANRFGLRDDARDDCHTLSLVGELDVASSPQLQAEIARLCEQGAREIVLDLHELEFIDSTGLRVILTSSQHCERYGCEFSRTRAQAPAQRLFELSGVVGRISVRGKALAQRLARRSVPAERIQVDRLRPDFEVSLDLNLDAPRSARNYVRDLLRADGSHDMREAVMLLTSELITPIVQRGGPSTFLESGDLRVWLRPHLVRVELRVTAGLLSPESDRDATRHEAMVFDQVADRWAIENSGATARAWFEIDRQPAAGGEPGERSAQREDHRSAGAQPGDATSF